MKVIFITSLEAYETNCFPDNITIPPRVGDNVAVVESLIDYYSEKNLPLWLKVTNVMWTEKGVICELI
jgi:hypothetical protein